MLKRFFLLLIVILASQVQAEPYRLVVLPDTQCNSEKWPQQLTTMTEWIAKNQQPLNIKYLLHVGDMVEHGNSEQEWKNFDTSMRVLDGKVPYVLAVGNHDFDKIAGNRSTVMFDKHFPPERFSKLPSFPTRVADKANSYRTFSAAGTDWLIVTMPFLPTDEQLEGANRVVKEHPDHRVIVLTHSYLTHTGRDKSGIYIWEKLVKRYRNISLVVCGHLSTVHFVSQGDQGNKVYEMLFDWQNDKKPEPNSYLAILEFDLDAAKLSVKSYSPTLDKYLTDPRGQFEFRDVDFLKGKAKATTSGQAASNNPDVRTLLDQGTKALDGGNVDEAIDNYRKALEIKPDYAEAHDKLGLALAERGQIDEAIAEYTAAIRLDPKSAKAYSDRALAYIDLGDNDKAIKDCTEAIRIAPDRAETYSIRGYGYHGKGDDDKAIADESEAIRLDPKCSAGYRVLGGIFNDKLEWEKAISNFDKAIQLDPRDAKAYQGRGTPSNTAANSIRRRPTTVKHSESNQTLS
jgi:tetratricopeptide (TPR) repeat protein